MFNVTNNFEFLRNKDVENFAKWLEELSDKEKAAAKQKAEEAAKGAILKQDVLINKSLSNEQTRMFEWGDSGMNANLTTILEGFQDPRLPLYMTKNQADVECEDGKTIVSGTQYLGIRGGCEDRLFLYNSFTGNDGSRRLFLACGRCVAWLE